VPLPQVGYLHKDAAAFGKQFAGQQQPVTQVGKVGVDAQLPGVAKSPDLLRLGGEVVVLAVLDVALVDKGLEVGAVADAVGRVEIDHLHLACHTLLFQQRVHHQQAVTRHQPVGPAMRVLVEIYRLAQRFLALHIEERHLLRAAAGALSHCLDDGA
jgi:hypothetical protein